MYLWLYLTCQISYHTLLLTFHLSTCEKSHSILTHVERIWNARSTPAVTPRPQATTLRLIAARILSPAPVVKCKLKANSDVFNCFRLHPAILCKCSLCYYPHHMEKNDLYFRFRRIDLHMTCSQIYFGTSDQIFSACLPCIYLFLLSYERTIFFLSTYIP